MKDSVSRKFSEIKRFLDIIGNEAFDKEDLLRKAKNRFFNRDDEAIVESAVESYLSCL